MNSKLQLLVIVQSGLDSGDPLRRGGAFKDAHDVGLLHDQELLTTELHLGARPLAEQDAVAGLDVERAQLALVVQRAGADGDDLTLLRLLLGGVGDEDATRGLLFGRHAANENAVMQGTEAHAVLSQCFWLIASPSMVRVPAPDHRAASTLPGRVPKPTPGGRARPGCSSVTSFGRAQGCPC